MAITLLQSASASPQNVKPVVGAYGSNVTAGSLLVAAVYLRDTDAATATDTRGNTWVVAGIPHPGTFADNSRQFVIMYALNAQAGATTVTATHAGAGTMDMAIHEFGGFTNAALDKIAYVEASTSPISSASVTTTISPAELVVSGAASTGTVLTGSDSDGFTIDQEGAPFDSAKSKHLVVSSLGTYGPASYRFTVSGSDSTWVGIAAFGDVPALTVWSRVQFSG